MSVVLFFNKNYNLKRWSPSIFYKFISCHDALHILENVNSGYSLHQPITNNITLFCCTCCSCAMIHCIFLKTWTSGTVSISPLRTTLQRYCAVLVVHVAHSQHHTWWSMSSSLIFPSILSTNQFDGLFLKTVSDVQMLSHIHMSRSDAVVFKL